MCIRDSGRRVPKRTVYKSMTIAALGFAAVVMNAAVILITLPNLSGVDGLSLIHISQKNTGRKNRESLAFLIILY